MKLGTQVFILALSVIALFLHAQGRGMINHMEREKVIKVVSNLKTEMTETEVIAFLKSRSLELDWGAIGTNHVELWYRFGITATNIEELRVTLKARQDISFELWRKQHLTNSSFVEVQIFKSDKGGLIPIPFTNAPNRDAATNINHTVGESGTADHFGSGPK